MGDLLTPPAITVHATIAGRRCHIAIRTRDGELLPDTVDRGVCVLLDMEDALVATGVWSEPIKIQDLMGTEFPGEFREFDYTDEQGEVQ